MLIQAFYNFLVQSFFRLPMKITFHLQFVFVQLFLIAIVTEPKTISKYPKLLVVSFDGFRYDYINKTDLPNLRSLINSGGYVEELTNVFITKTFPNHHTIATGQYVEDHGVVANVVFDPVLDKVLNSKDSELFTYNKSVIPIWTLNELADSDRYSGSVMWVGAEYEVKEKIISHKMTYNQSFPWMSRVDVAFSWLLDDLKPANLVMLYIEEPDSIGHQFGPDSPEIIDVLIKIDNLVGYIYKKIESSGIALNLIITTDHGMMFTPEKNLIDLNIIINSSDYKYYGGSPVLNIFPEKDKEDDVFNRLFEASKTQAFNVYKLNDIPGRYHYSHNDRIGPIIVEAHKGYFFQDYKELPWHKNGSHGYDNSLKEMHGLMITYGPSFSHVKIETASNLDIFSLMCKVLELEPSINSGNFSNVAKLIKNKTEININILLGLTLGLGLFGLLAVTCSIYLCIRWRKGRKKQAEIGKSILQSFNTLYSEEEEHLLATSNCNES